MKGYKNMQGGIQCEAARAILEKHDSSYFPGANDDFMPAKKAQQRATTGKDGIRSNRRSKHIRKSTHLLFSLTSGERNPSAGIFGRESVLFSV